MQRRGTTNVWGMELSRFLKSQRLPLIKCPPVVPAYLSIFKTETRMKVSVIAKKLAMHAPQRDRHLHRTHCARPGPQVAEWAGG